MTTKTYTEIEHKRRIELGYHRATILYIIFIDGPFLVDVEETTREYSFQAAYTFQPYT